MNPLLPTDSIRLQAARSCLELGNYYAASAELDKITPQMRSHPDVLKTRWAIHSFAGELEAALDIALAHIKSSPDDPWGWIYYSFSLSDLKRIAQARDTLLQVVDQFPQCADMHYYLARYEFQMGRLGQAKALLQRAFALDNSGELKLAALTDSDLKPFWDTFGHL